MKWASISAAILFAMLGFFVQPAGAQHGARGSEQALLQSANRERESRGLAPLKWSDSLADAARQHAQLLAQENTLSHQFPGELGLAERTKRAGARFSSVAENIAEGPSAEVIHRLWMNSPPHRANLLDPRLDSVGIAVTDRNGTLFAVQDFSLAGGNLSIHDQEESVERQIHERGLHILDYTDDARRSCGLDHGYAGSHRPSFVLHYATPDLQSLPEMLEQRIETGRYHSAVVGACPGDTKTSFSMYRIAVMLYE
jgi:hypothetical protein